MDTPSHPDVAQPSRENNISPAGTGNSQKKKPNVEFLQENIQKRIDGFVSRRDFNRRNAFVTKILATSLSVVVTILLGLRVVGGETQLANAALIVSGLLTLLNALEGFFNFRPAWIRYTVALNNLYSLKSDLEYRLSKGMETVPDEELDKFYHRFTEILAEANEDWQSIKRDNFRAPLV